MWKNCLLIAMLLVLSWTNSLADEARVELHRGDTYRPTEDGFFITKQYAADLVANHQAALEKLQAELDNFRKRQAADLELEKAKCEVQKAEVTEKLASCDARSTAERVVYGGAVERLSQQLQTPWYKTPYFNFALGIAACGATVGAVRGAEQ